MVTVAKVNDPEPSPLGRPAEAVAAGLNRDVARMEISRKGDGHRTLLDRNTAADDHPCGVPKMISNFVLRSAVRGVRRGVVGKGVGVGVGKGVGKTVGRVRDVCW